MSSNAAGSGVALTDHVRPFQDSTSVSVIDSARILKEPTALQLVALTQDTPLNRARLLGFGLLTTDHVEPSQDSTSVALPELPTASQALALAHETPAKRLLVEDFPLLGLATTDQAVPFHTSTSVRNGPVVE